MFYRGHEIVTGVLLGLGDCDMCVIGPGDCHRYVIGPGNCHRRVTHETQP